VVELGGVRGGVALEEEREVRAGEVGALGAAEPDAGGAQVRGLQRALGAEDLDALGRTQPRTLGC